MIIMPDLTELALTGPVDRNVPNQERLILRPQMALELGYYCVALGFRLPDSKSAIPIPGSAFWFGEAAVAPSDWIFLYTGAGKNYVGTMPGGTDRALVYYWSRPMTTFTHSSIVPMIFRFAAVQVGAPGPPAASESPNLLSSFLKP